MRCESPEILSRHATHSKCAGAMCGFSTRSPSRTVLTGVPAGDPVTMAALPQDGQLTRWPACRVAQTSDTSLTPC